MATALPKPWTVDDFLAWEAQQPEVQDHYYMIESREPLIALSFSAFRCDIDLASGRILSKESLK